MVLLLVQQAHILLLLRSSWLGMACLVMLLRRLPSCMIAEHQLVCTPMLMNGCPVIDIQVKQPGCELWPDPPAVPGVDSFEGMTCIDRAMSTRLLPPLL